MSLIQQALERAHQSSGHSDTRHAPLRSPAEVAAEKKQLETLEKKIDEIKKQNRVSHLASWVIGGICLCAIAAGVYGFYYGIQKQPVPMTQSENFLAMPLANITNSAPASVKKDLVLSGITVSGGVRYALINNQVVTIGDMMRKENTIVKEIQERSVVVEQNGRLRTLPLE